MVNDVRKRLFILVGVVGLALLLLLPTLLRGNFTDQWISKPLSLGLDLSGGVHLVYRVETDEAVKSKLQALATSIKSRLRDPDTKVVVSRARALNAEEVEFLFSSDLLAKKARAIIEADYREISFKSESKEGRYSRILYSAPAPYIEKIKRESVSQAIETLRERVDQFGVAEPLIQRAGEERILLQMPGVSDIQAVKRIVGSVAKLEFRLLPPTGSTKNTVVVKSKEGGTERVEDEALMSGDAVDDARVAFDQGKVEVSLAFTSEGGKTFKRITAANVGRQLAIILDGVLYSSPVIQEAIGGGRASISGGFAMEEARELAVILRAGALPAPLTVLEERTVGPTLGKESIQNGIIAIVVGLLAIAAFMLTYYKKSGAVAVLSLVINVFLVVGVLSAFGATLTLPGLAGLALTVGMAVDSNVIIFERIREELRTGAGRDVAVNTGYEKALSAIIDSNVTGLLAALILYYFGTGAIRGFAVTTSIGIATTLFCAVFAARLFFDLFELRSKDGMSI